MDRRNVRFSSKPKSVEPFGRILEHSIAVTALLDEIVR
jgi:hypothetical protein